MTAPLAAAVIAALRQQGLTLAAAESCTGGLVAKLLTDVPGASRAFLGGVVSYTNGVKQGVLGVPEETLAAYGAVSPETARAMAQGVRRITGADLGISVTGVAGPDRDDRGNEVGTVYAALSAAAGTFVRKLAVGCGSREEIRSRAAEEVLKMVLAQAAPAE